ncbi:MAG: site-specific DNA-methyltransferase [Epsilonproteobacteria bacterium]|nr:MAG: site-specific DNA-methyltransferase [Campylobacterota bacterium]
MVAPLHIQKEITTGLKINEIYNEDCLIGMHKIKDNSISLILCDLPYGTTQNKWDCILPLNDYIKIEIKIKNKMKEMCLNKEDYKIYCFDNNINSNQFKINWDKNSKLGLWSHYNRIIKDNGAIVLFGAQPFTSKLINSNIKNFKYDWTWSKTKGTGHLNAKRQPLRDKEDILVFYKQQCKYNPQFSKGKAYDGAARAGKKHQTSSYGEHGQFREKNDGKRYPRQILKFDIVGRGSLHPTQKPVDLLEYLIKTYTDENEVVLDNCMGVGSTAIGCINTNRSFLGFELSKDYFDISQQRISDAMGK